MNAVVRRFIPLFVLILLPQLSAAAPVGAAAVAADAVVPRGAATVTGPVLHLGDLFANVGDKADRRVGSTPPPGTPLTIEATTLQRIASANGLSWRPVSVEDRTVVERDSVVLTEDEIVDAILAALAAKGMPTDGLNVDLTLGSRQYYRPREGQMQVDAVTVDQAGVRFGAVLAIVTPGETRQTLAVTGRLQRTIGVPVLLRPLRPGEVIDDSDIGWAQVSDRQVSSSAVRDRDTMMGKSARRALAAGAPVLVSDLQPTKVVEKGQPVTVLLELPGMQLSARGTAMEAGAIGQTIGVLNERSKATMQGVVISAGTVRVPATAVRR